MAKITYLEAVELINNYYGNPDILENLFYHKYTAEEIAQLSKQVPGLSTTISNSGKVLGYDYDMSLAQPASSLPSINSNTTLPTYGVESSHSLVPANTDIDGNFVEVTSGAKTVATGATLATVADKLSLAFIGVSLGTKLGKAIDSAIYSVDPAWWDTHYPTINPETWDDIATTQEGRQFIRGIFGLQNDDTTMYADERLLAQTYMMLKNAGVYERGVSHNQGAVTPGNNFVFTSDLLVPSGQRTWPADVEFAFIEGDFMSSTDSRGRYMTATATRSVKWFKVRNASQGYFTISLEGSYSIDTKSYTASGSIISGSSGVSNSSSGTLNINGVATRFWFARTENQSTGMDGSPMPLTGNVPNAGSLSLNAVATSLVAVLLYGNIVTPSSVEGIQDDPRAQTYINPSLITGTTLEEVLQQLKNNYPDLFSDAIYEDVVQEDGTVNRYTYIPVPTPDATIANEPVTGDTYQGSEAINPQTESQSLLDMIRDILVTNGEPPDTGSGDSPAIVVPVGTASSLWKIYNPTESELNSFASWLWTDNLIEQFKKLFNSPMDAVIGVHKVFATPSVGGRANIKCGYLDSGVSSNYIDSQYVTIDCGTVSLREYFGNVFDYSPYTEISLFLPFIGIVKLDSADVMRADISIKYSVDVLTGACLAEVKVIRDSAGGNLYVFSGSAIVQYPLTSGSYAGAIAGVLSIAGGLAGSLLSGGSMIPAAVGVINGASRLRADVQKSGGFSGCAGAMGCKIPYLIISRPQTAVAENFQHFTGIPANSLVTLSACSGRTRVKAIHVENINKATNEEKDIIEQLLKSGVTI